MHVQIGTIQRQLSRMITACMIQYKFVSILSSSNQRTKVIGWNRKALICYEKDSCGREMEESGSSNIRRFRRICVFCGSSFGNKEIFSQATLELGKEMVERKINLVYGGGSSGLMGLISTTVHDGGCHVLGVIPTALMPLEISGQTVGELKVVTDMHERKAEMARQAEAFIALPGGYGTLEEVLEIIAWSQLGIHDKPVGLLNVDGYYNSLIAFFDKGVEEGFIDPAARHIFVSASTGKELLQRMEEYVPIHASVAPRQSWEMENQNLGYSDAPNTS